jgi:hypothetical protein
MTSAAKKFAEHHNEDVKRTIEKVTVAGEEATRRMEDIFSKVTQETIEFQQRLLATTHANVDAAFECARELLVRYLTIRVHGSVHQACPPTVPSRKATDQGTRGDCPENSD